MTKALLALRNLFGRKTEIENLEKQVEVMREELATISNEALTPGYESLQDLIALSNSASGVSVTPTTSMKLSIVFACVRLIAGAIAQMPVHTYKLNADGERVRKPDMLEQLLNLQPNDIFSSATFWEYMVMSMLLEGDAFGVVMRDGAGQVDGILPLSPTHVQVEKKNGRLMYFVSIDGKVYAFDQDDILHLPGFGFNGLRSMSVIRWGALNSIGLQLAMEEYSGNFFKRGAHQSVIVFKKGKWGEGQKDALRDSWVKTYGGSDKAHLPIVVDDTVDIKTLSVNQRDAQLIEQREYQITDIARAFGIPSFMVNQEQKSTSFGSGMTEISLAFLKYTLMPHINRFEKEINRKFYLRKPGRFAEFKVDALTRSTLKERNDAYRQAVGGSQGPGWLTINEIRRVENRPRINDKKFDMPYYPDKNSAPSQEPENEADE